jgi:glycosyltransferase involved in cell wall biosynthesis
VNITHVAYTDLQGGAARSAYRLHRGLVELGEDSRLFVERRESDDPTVIAFRYSNGLMTRFGRRWRRWLLYKSMRFLAKRAAEATYFSDDRSQHLAAPLSQLPPWQILHLHWISGFLDYQAFFRRVPQDRPIVWTLHDMNAFTGGCHFDGGCGRFVESCGACPQLRSRETDDFSRAAWRRKHVGYDRLKPNVLHLVTPSKWLAEQVRRSSLLGANSISVIPYGLDTDVFRSRDRGAARDIIGMRQDAKVVLFLADAACEARKGLTLLVDALKAMPDNSNLCLLILGRGQIALPLSIPKVLVDYVRSDNFLSMIYSAADLFVAPALEDNLPNTVLEALACGVPVVAFSTGGIPDMIRDGIEGRLVPRGDVAALRAAISSVLDDRNGRAAMAANARQRAIQEYGLRIQANRYLNLYRSLQEERGESAAAKQGGAERRR